jgi:hypothetical protein
MELFLNITLVITGFMFSISAIGGDTYNKGSQPLLERITKRGWLSIICLLLTLGCGVAKEYLSAKKSVAAENTIGMLSHQLSVSETEQHAYQDTILVLQRQLQEATATKLAKAMYDLTSRIPHEMDFAIVNFDGGKEETPISSESQSPLLLYGGDEFEYHLFCREDLSKVDLKLIAGERTYPISTDNGTIRIMGPIGIPLRCHISNPFFVKDGGMKIIIRSTDATRMRNKYGDIINSKVP